MKQLHDRYKDRDVVFLGIHTAGTDMTLIKRLLKQQAWDLAVGLDTGDDMDSGQTTRSFAIHGYPTVMVIDPNGKIAFNSHDTSKDPKVFLRDMEAMAKSAGVRWPIDKDADDDEIRRRITRLQVFIFGLQIDKALQNPAE
jgi:hypothetical protein